jgi:hypothetical protein
MTMRLRASLLACLTAALPARMQPDPALFVDGLSSVPVPTCPLSLSHLHPRGDVNNRMRPPAKMTDVHIFLKTSGAELSGNRLFDYSAHLLADENLVR